MTRLRKATTNEHINTMIIKPEPQVKEEPELLDDSIKQEFGDNARSLRKRKLSPVYMNLDFDEDDPVLRTNLLDDDEDFEHVTAESQTGPKKKQKQTRYKMSCQHYKAEFKVLPDPRGLSHNISVAVYKRTMDLVLFLKAEMDHQQTELAKIRKLRTEANKKLAKCKEGLIESKGRVSSAETKAEVLEQQVKDLHLELTSKLARPLSHAQIKLESVHHDYATEMADLRAVAATDRKAKEDVERLIAMAHTEMANFEMNLSKERFLKEQAEQLLDELRKTTDQLKQDKADSEQRLHEATTVTVNSESEEHNEVENTTGLLLSKNTDAASTSNLDLENQELKVQVQKLQGELSSKQTMIDILLKELQATKQSHAN